MKPIFKKFSLFASLMLFTAFAFAQANNLIVFSNDGYRFTLIVNGLKQNEKPETNVKVTGLTASNYKLRVIFEDANNATIDQNMYMAWGGEEIHGKELNCAIVKNKKGELKLRPESVGELSTAPVANQVIYQFNTSGAGTPIGTYSNTTTTTTTTTQGNTESINMNVGMGGTPVGTTTTVTSGTAAPGTTTTTTSSTTTTTGTSDNVNVGVGVPGGSIGISINVNDGMGGTSTSTSTTTTTTSSSTTTTAPAPVQSGGCYYPMSSADFAKAKASVQEKSFEDSKLTVAKQILNSNCLSSAQVKEIMQLFTYEETKLDWAKFAYGKTTDPGNYFQLNDAFGYETSIEELNKYIESRK